VALIVLSTTVGGAIILYNLWVGPRLICPCYDVPYTLGMEAGATSNPASGLFYEALVIAPTSGLTTGLFGLIIINDSGDRIGPGSVPSKCAAPADGSLTSFTPGNCSAPVSDWYAVLVFENTTIQSALGSTEHWSATAPLERGTAQIYIVSKASFAGIGWSIAAYSTWGASVSGVAEL